MDNQQEPAGEDFAQLITRIMDTYEVNESEVARRLGVHHSTVNMWVQRKRGTARGPATATLLKIHETFPRFTLEEISAAAKRKAPGPLDADATKRLLDLFAGLTAEQQEFTETQLRALNEANRAT
ncbi:XRE family transcriptional regulator [Streptomyces sp. RKAG337]|uniref:XRE family transcriptional regulator n=1 Tax=Streptomyces sp. RKAG337 TaxID=2893404 RepID=UPI0020345BE2|nr:XRE family transcriptional regulator [Streptomyces sp. RKAG337]MCM2427346.1 XRE family transcriptional regulator [Streptomyces sp. RKAG337]